MVKKKKLTAAEIRNMNSREIWEALEVARDMAVRVWELGGDKQKTESLYYKIRENQPSAHSAGINHFPEEMFDPDGPLGDKCFEKPVMRHYEFVHWYKDYRNPDGIEARTRDWTDGSMRDPVDSGTIGYNREDEIKIVTPRADLPDFEVIRIIPPKQLHYKIRMEKSWKSVADAALINHASHLWYWKQVVPYCYHTLAKYEQGAFDDVPDGEGIPITLTWEHFREPPLEYPF